MNQDPLAPGGRVFSDRTGWDMTPNPLSTAADSRRARGLPVLDWTVSNPTVCGFRYPDHAILQALSSPRSLHYDPDPRGLPGAREAIAAWYDTRGTRVLPDNILVTAGSSEAYSFLFRILCNPGETVAIPRPGYPLFDDLARINDVRVSPYRFRYENGWHLDPESLKRAVTGDARALVVVHPNNPTGAYLDGNALTAFTSLASHRRIPIIGDEVFFSYPFDTVTSRTSLCGLDAPLVFTINGLSKLAALPQMKLGWITVSGSDCDLIGEAVARLEMVADTYLSVGTPVQAALPEMLAAAESTGEAVRIRTTENYSLLRDKFAGSAVTVLQSEGGWNVILRLPSVRSDEVWAMALLEEEGLLVYPGYFFDLDLEACIVVSLLPEPSILSGWAEILRAHVERRL